MAARRQLEGRYAAAVRWLGEGRRALDGLDDHPSVELRAGLAERRARLALTQHRLRTAARWADRAVEEARSVAAFAIMARATAVRDLARCNAGGHIDLAEAARTLALLDEERDLEPVALCTSSYGVIAYEQGDWTAAAAYYAAAAAAYRRLGRQLDIALMSANEAEILIPQGELDRAEQLLTEAVAIWRSSHSLGEQGFGTTQLGRVALARGSFETAHRLFDEARGLHQQADETFDVLGVECWLAECEARSGDLGSALVRIRKVAEQEARLGPLLRHARRVEGIARIGVGEVDAGAGLLRSSADLAREAAVPYDVALALVELERWGVGTTTELEELGTLRTRLAVQLGVDLAPAPAEAARRAPAGSGPHAGRAR
jgi:ATP/maltotriose-dependent transcriptional regulator MalT